MAIIYKREIQRLFPILEAIKEGKTIQYKDTGVWRDIDGDDEGFCLGTLVRETDSYRIKPKYRHFKDAEECWNEMQKHQPFGWVKCGGRYFSIVSVDNFFAYLSDSNSSAILLASKNSYNDNTFVDGTPFGVKLEE